MKYAIYTVVNNNINKSLITILSSAKYNNVDHYIFYEQNDSCVTNELIEKFSQLQFVQIESIANDIDYKLFSKYVEDHHHPAMLFTVEFLKNYTNIIYLSDRIHVTKQFSIENYDLSSTFLAPPVSVPYKDNFVSNSFIDSHKLNNRTYLSEDFVVINTKRFINNNVLERLAKFSEDLYYQSKLELNTNTLIRIPSHIVYNMFTANNESFNYLPQNFMLDIEYTSDFVGEMVSFYQPTQLDYYQKFDEQIEFIELDLESDVYNLEYLIILLQFMLEENLALSNIVNYNIQYIEQVILDRNLAYQMRLGQC